MAIVSRGILRSIKAIPDDLALMGQLSRITDLVFSSMLMRAAKIFESEEIDTTSVVIHKTQK